MNCLFCQIAKNEVSSLTLYEDEIVKVFLDINPDSNGHTLIVPKKHYLDITDIDDDTLHYINSISKKIFNILNISLNPDGIKLVQNNGFIQVIKHYHLHLIPVYKNAQPIENINKIYEIIKEKL